MRPTKRKRKTDRPTRVVPAASLAGRPDKRVAWWAGAAAVAICVALSAMLPAQLDAFVRTADPLQRVAAASTAVHTGTTDRGLATYDTVSWSVLDRETWAADLLTGGPALVAGRFGGDGDIVPRHDFRDLRLTPSMPPYVASGPGQYEVRVAVASGRVEHSLFEAAQKAGLSEPLILRLAEIFGWDIDFALDVTAGDTFTVIYEERYWLGRKIGTGPILAAEFYNRGEVHRAIAFRGEDGRVEYYTPQGRTLKRAFLRSPVKFSRISSGFSEARYHPILKLWRAHTGVDYAAPAGTPVRATAEGRVAALGWHGGYGNTVVIDHGQAYSTLYAHLSGYRPNLRAGQHVKQGETIGYVGQTGLANGVHLHYEFRIDGRHHDPLTFEFPGGAYINAEERERFLRVADAWVTRLQLASDRHIASTGLR